MKSESYAGQGRGGNVWMWDVFVDVICFPWFDLGTEFLGDHSEFFCESLRTLEERGPTLSLWPLELFPGDWGLHTLLLGFHFMWAKLQALAVCRDSLTWTLLVPKRNAYDTWSEFNPPLPGGAMVRIWWSHRCGPDLIPSQSLTYALFAVASLKKKKVKKTPPFCGSFPPTLWDDQTQRSFIALEVRSQTASEAASPLPSFCVQIRGSDHLVHRLHPAYLPLGKSATFKFKLWGCFLYSLNFPTLLWTLASYFVYVCR